jgi:hypothetical protein
MNIADRLRRAGCFASGAATLALFFAVGAAVSLVSGDWLPTLQAVVVAALFTGAALWLARRHAARVGK